MVHNKSLSSTRVTFCGWKEVRRIPASPPSLGEALVDQGLQRLQAPGLRDRTPPHVPRLQATGDARLLYGLRPRQSLVQRCDYQHRVRGEVFAGPGGVLKTLKPHRSLTADCLPVVCESDRTRAGRQSQSRSIIRLLWFRNVQIIQLAKKYMKVYCELMFMPNM